MEFEKLREHIIEIDSYKSILLEVEEFLNANKLKIEEDMEYTFWNHVGCLLQRIENNEQNSLEIPPEHGINQEDFILADKMIDTIIFPKLGIEITEFETFLLALYFKIFNKERRES